MKFEPSWNYCEIDQRALEEGIVTAWISRAAEDTCWDGFLSKSPLGQFQQSTIWAQAKKVEGWKPLRVVFTVEDVIVGGFQILERSSWWGKIGYVSKGPVILPDRPALSFYATEILRKLARKEKLWTLIVQPPDLCAQMSAKLAAAGFLLNVLIGVNEATWITDLRGGFEVVEREMSKETRKKARQAVNRGLSIREGGKQDLGTFFNLMLSTCRRQGVSPNPPDVGRFLALWDAAQFTASTRLFFAEYEGIPITGQFCIVFGGTVTFWKKGWNLTEDKRNPNDFLVYEVLKWASSSGYQSADFCAFDTDMAVAILKKDPLTEEQKNTRYMFLVRCSGKPHLLPEARVYFPNLIIRFAYSMIFYKKIRTAKRNRKLIDQTVGLTQNV